MTTGGGRVTGARGWDSVWRERLPALPGCLSVGDGVVGQGRCLVRQDYSDLVPFMYLEHLFIVSLRSQGLR